MKLGIRGKLFLVSVALIATSVLVAALFLSSALSRQLTERIDEELLHRLALIDRQATQGPKSLDDLPAWDAFADEVGRLGHARVTIIRADGVVLGDSSVDTAALPTLENHLQRPEVQAALRTGTGASTGTTRRFSSTTREGTLYAAAPLVRDGATIGIVRVAQPLADVTSALRRVRNTLFVATGLALAIAALFVTAASHSMTRELKDMTAAAQRMAAGDLAVRSRVNRDDEIGNLGHALDHLASSLSTTLSELREERDLLDGILRSMDEGVLVVDPDGRIAMVNPALRAMLFLGADVVGRTPLEAIRHAELQSLFGRERKNGDEPVLKEIELAGALKPRRVLVRVTPLGSIGATTGAGVGKLAVFVDVTEIRRLESLRRDFVANVSHELRTPVTSIRSAAETLQGAAGKDPQAAQVFADIVQRNAERLHALVEDLLDLSRLESREYKLHIEAIELPTLVGHTLALFQERASKKGVSLKADTPADLLPARGDRRALEQVLSNLVDNAIKYCPAGSAITVRAETNQAGSSLVVRDTGPGIDASHLPRIFERFYRVDAGRSRDVGGTGLGLSIVKHLVEAMGGRVTVDSAPGRGTTFTVTLPRAPEK